MTDDPPTDAALPVEAGHILGYLIRYGGSVRVGPLVRHCGVPFDALAAVVNALAERGWVKITFRRPRQVLPPDLPERCREVDRITVTRYGRWRYATTWPRD
jgi:hypothetical protein